MIRVEFDPADLVGDQQVWFVGWERRADRAMRRVLEGWHPPMPAPVLSSTVEALWQELRDWLLLNVFQEKCGYCEQKLYRQCRDAEHYRPKGRVREAPPDHPGYFWLALDWRNLVPSCEPCNRLNGKMDQFPVARAHVRPAVPLPSSDDLDLAEEPLLLHPYRDDPTPHLRFGAAGSIVGLTPMGEATIGVFDLAGKVDRARLAARHAAHSRFLAALGSLPPPAPGTTQPERHREARARILDDEIDSEPFGAAVRAILEDLVQLGSMAEP